MSTLPHELQVGKFLSSRNNEIQMLYNEISKSEPFGGLASQQVTRRMRRRAVSHNPKRLPRRLRNAHISQRNKSEIMLQVEHFGDQVEIGVDVRGTC